MFFNGFMELGRIAILGTLSYISLIILLRWIGSRSLSRMNAYDFVVTIALGSTLSTILLSKSVSLSEGVFALFVLLGLQYIVSWLSVRWPPFSSLITSQPTLLFYDGTMLHLQMKRSRVRDIDILSAIRKARFASLDEVTAVILETDGSLSVVRKNDQTPSALNNINTKDVDSW